MGEAPAPTAENLPASRARLPAPLVAANFAILLWTDRMNLRIVLSIRAHGIDGRQ
jgi:hypothetical protein